MACWTRRALARQEPSTIDHARVDAVIAKTFGSVPRGAAHWSTRTMASQTADGILASVERSRLRTANPPHQAASHAQRHLARHAVLEGISQ